MSVLATPANTHLFDIFHPEKSLGSFFMGDNTTNDSLHRIIETFSVIPESFSLLSCVGALIFRESSPAVHGKHFIASPGNFRSCPSY